MEKVEDFCFRALLGTWIFLSQQTVAAIIPQLLPFAVTAYLAAPLLYFLFIHISVVSSGHFALQTLGICRSCYEILLSERKKETFFLKQPQNMLKIQQTPLLL